MEEIETLREWKREDKEYLDVKRAHPTQEDFKVFSRVMALKGLREAKMTDLDYAQVFSMGPEGLTLKGVEKAPVIKVPVASSPVPPIFFNVKEAREHLLEKGFVHTLRRERSTGLTHARYGSFYKFEDLGPVNIELIKKVMSLEDLRPYLHSSGFKTVEEWLEKAEEGADHLYKVTKQPTLFSSSPQIPPIVRTKWEEHQKAAKLGLEHEPFLPLPALAKWYEKWKETAIASGISPDDFDDAFLYLDLGLETPEMEDQLKSYLPTLEKPLSEQEREYREALKDQALDAAKVVREALEARLISPREAGLYRRRPRDIQELSKLRDEVEMLRQQLEMVKREEIPKPPAVVKIKFRYPWSMLKIDKEVLGPFKKGDILEAPREKVESLVGKGYAEYVGVG